MSLFPPPQIIVAMDFESAEVCLKFAEKLDPSQCRLKVGNELFTSAGPVLLEKLMNLGFTIFLDLKYHDIPNTVAKAVRVAAELGVWMVNVHLSGGIPMLAAAREALSKHSGSNPLLVGVTVLTSMSQGDLKSVGIESPLGGQVMRLAALAQQTGLDGIVCSALEAKPLREQFGQDFCLVTPGIRFSGYPVDDQSRIASPQEAINSGSNYLVIGRPITKANNATEALASIIKSLSIERWH
jgi:orotidine-5'-phosphate decarboxylase